MRAISFAFPFRSTFRRLELEKRWWHRLCVVTFHAVLLGTTVFSAWVSYSVFAPQITTMPDIELNIQDWTTINSPTPTPLFDMSKAVPIIPPPPSGTIVKNDPYAPYGGHEIDRKPVPVSNSNAGAKAALPPLPPGAHLVAQIDPSAGFVPGTYKPLDKTIQMPDGSTSRFAGTVSDDAIKAQWNHAENRQTLMAIMWAVLFTIVSALFISYLFQIAYRALLYVIFGTVVHAQD